MHSREILQKYIKFYEDRGHKLVPNMSLVPQGDSTLLFVNSGMFPLVPYLSGEPHPLGKRLVNVQRALRFEDIDEVGTSNRHTTCFHMMGNWSLGDYFKDEQLPWAYEFLIEVLGLDINRIYATVFEGDEYAPKDEQAISILKEIFKKYGVDAKERERIFAYGREDNWWQRGDAPGELGGPDSEIFYYVGDDGVGLGKSPADFQDEFIEIGNSVFMQYRRTNENGWEELPQKNVDFGGGLERIAFVAQGKKDIYETDMFWPIIEKLQGIEGLFQFKYRDDEATTRAMRIIVDHMRASVFLAMDGVLPSNKDQGYILRRYLRRIARFSRHLSIERSLAPDLVPVVAEMFGWLYPEIKVKQNDIINTFREEEMKFRNMLLRATPQVKKRLERVSAPEELVEQAFDLYQALGYPPEFFLEDARDFGFALTDDEFWPAYKGRFSKHQQQSSEGAEQKFKGGLADHSDEVVRYHTATHLIHQALREVLGEHVIQRGSNITGERLRFDFSHPEKLTDQQIEQVNKVVNEKIQVGLPVNFIVLPKEEAEKTGAIHAFGEKYGDQVKIYFVGDSLDTAYSKEFCGGPHVTNTSEIGEIELYKQESVGKGLRRVYARFKS